MAPSLMPYYIIIQMEKQGQEKLNLQTVAYRR